PDRLRSPQPRPGGAPPTAALITQLRDCPVAGPDPSQRGRMRDVYADDDGVYAHLAYRLFDNDPAMLAMLLDDFDKACAGYELKTLCPSIECPVLLLQADALRGSATTDGEVALALACLPRPRHKFFPGLSHLLFIE